MKKRTPFQAVVLEWLETHGHGAQRMLADIVGSRAETLIKHYQHVTRKMHRAAMDKIPELDVGHTVGYTNKIYPAGDGEN